MSSDPFGDNESLVVQGARRFGIRPALALAVAWQESRLQQDAVSPTGAVGIMQVEPDTSKLAAKDLGVPIDPTTAADNVTAGLFWLHSLLNSYHNDEASALAAYYEGPGNLARRGYLVAQQNTWRTSGRSKARCSPRIPAQCLIALGRWRRPGAGARERGAEAWRRRAAGHCSFVAGQPTEDRLRACRGSAAGYCVSGDGKCQ